METRGVGAASAVRSSQVDEAVVPRAVVTTTEEIALAQISDQLDEQQRASRQARRATQELQHVAQDQQVQHMRDASEQRFFGAIASASGKIAAAGASACGQGAAAQGASQTATAAGEAIGGWFQSEAGRADAAAAQSGHRAEREGQLADEQREDAQRSERAQEQTVQHLSAILDARRQAEQAALRG